MYLHLGGDTVVQTDSIIGIFDLENTSLSKYTREFLAAESKENEVFNVSMDMPKSFIVCENPKTKKQTIYISQISSRTLWKRAQNSTSQKFFDE